MLPKTMGSDFARSVTPIPMAVVASQVAGRTWDISASPPGQPHSSVRLQPESIARSLHDALKFKDWVAATNLATDFACQEADSWGRLPLVLSILGNAPPFVVQLILEAYPDAGSREAGQRELNNLPLHLAIAHRAPVVVLEMLLASYPEGAEVPDALGDLPLHSAVKFIVDDGAWTGPLPLNAVEEEEMEERFEALNFLGWTPQMAEEPQLYLGSDSAETLAVDGEACGSWQYEAVNRLLAVFPGAVAIKSNEGKLPLRLATEGLVPSPVVIRILRELHKFPETVRDCGRGGMLPLHVALERRAPDDVIHEIVTAHPQAIQCKTVFRGCELPIQIAVRVGASASVLQLLLPRRVKLSELQLKVSKPVTRLLARQPAHTGYVADSCTHRIQSRRTLERR
jgi:hypothetical protein